VGGLGGKSGRGRGAAGADTVQHETGFTRRVACFVPRCTGFAGRKTHLGEEPEGFVQPRDMFHQTATDPVQSRTSAA
jgi:hypothetical protein